MFWLQPCKSVTGTVCFDVSGYIYDTNVAWNAYCVKKKILFQYKKQIPKI